MMLRRNPTPVSLRSTHSRVVSSSPYSALASLYDALMWHVDYVHWAQYLVQIARKYSLPNGAWCEGGCGTGNIALRIAKMGNSISGFDIAPAMIDAARKKALEQNLPVKFATASFNDFSVQDLAFLFVVYDGVNYLLKRSELEAFLLRASASLQFNGLFVFDICTERNSLRNLFDWRDSQSRNGYHYIRHSWYERERQLHHNDFEIVTDSDPDTVFIENHLQRIYYINDVVTLLKATPLQLIAILGDTTFSPGTEHNDRVHFVCRNRL
ncbi:MAG: class I SAM-dependent methyltransferase [bacterium]|nr:class I SAM-dependent methyltransferase [bacterium]